MEIHLESTESHTIRSYSDQSILVGQTTLEQSCIISQQTIQTTWPIRHLNELMNPDLVAAVLQYHPEVIIIGHAGPSQFLPNLASELSRQRIGLECMSIGAACRTFNVLLSEGRNVVLGIIF
ncbi:MAG: MTH938/NDUFAF3 family protein [Legionellales bacterium]|nr:MTH938/NDUFAF3 family protein [Legionellales bacterium]